MIVRRLDGEWILIRQMDHAAHCGQIARAWRSGRFGAGAVSPALEHAAATHDLGWDEVDGDPEVGEAGAPINFTQYPEAPHARFYAAAVRTIAKTDPRAAYLVSLHASGLYGGRYGWRGFRRPDWTGMTDVGRNLLRGEREFRASIVAELDSAGVEFETAWRDYMLLQTFDIVSLLTCFGLDSTSCGPVPSLPHQFVDIKFDRVAPWDVRLEPFPFEGDELRLDVTCVRLRVERFGSDAELREMYRTAPRDQQPTRYLR